MERFVLIKFNEEDRTLVVTGHGLCLVVKASRIQRPYQVTEAFPFNTDVWG